MKKTLSVTAALALTLSMSAVAAADPVESVETTESTTTTTAPAVEETSPTSNTTWTFKEPTIKAEELVLNPTKIIELTEKTYFYDMPNGTIKGVLAPQKIDTTRTSAQVVADGEWVEIYTWLGNHWIFIGNN